MDVFDLYAKLSLDSKDYDRSLQNATNAADAWGTKFAMAAKAVVSGMSTVANAIGGITMKATESFGEYQQLTGGISKLFGTAGQSFEDWSKELDDSNGNLKSNLQAAKDKYASLTKAQNDMMNNAKKAFRTSGMSANEYMKNVTGFSASLINSLGGNTEEAARIADMAMQDIADNANTYGVYTAEELAGVYQALAKGNYTTLDNLNLGFGGTKEGLQQLIDKATELSGVKYDIGNYADIVQAIHTVQENMNITGTTANEAAGTLEGSTIKMKKAWENMLTSMVTGGEWFDESIEGVVESVKDYLTNMVPIVSSALQGFAALVTEISPIIAKELPGLVDDLLPDFITAIDSVIDGILTALPELLETLTGVFPMISDALVDLIPNLISFILEGIPLVIDAGLQLLTSLVSGLADNIETIVPKLTQGVIDMVNRLIEIIQGDGSNLANAGLALITGLANAMVTAVPDVLTQITQLIQDLTVSISSAADGEGDSFLTTATTILKNLVNNLMTSIPTLIPELTSAVSEFISQFASLAAENTTSLANAAIDILNSLVTSLGDAGTIAKVMTDITTSVMAIIDAIINVITNLDITTFANACVTIVTSLADGIVSAISVITDKLPELITGIVAWLTNPENITGIFNAAITIGGNLLSKVPAILEALA